MELQSARSVDSVWKDRSRFGAGRKLFAIAACALLLTACNADPQSTQEQAGHWQMLAFDPAGKAIGEAQAELKTPKELRTRLAKFCTDTGAKRILVRALAGSLQYQRSCEQVFMRSARDQHKR